MATSDHISMLTRLPEPVKPPQQRWQKLPTRPKVIGENTPVKSSRRQPTCTPKSVKGKKTPNHSIAKSVVTSACRFIPTRGTEDYSSYLVLKGDHGGDVIDDDEDDEEKQNLKEEKNEDYQSALLSVTCNGDVPRGVLTFRNTTPSITNQGSFLNYTTNSSIGSASISRSLLRESQRKQERRKISSKAEKILDAPSLMNDYYLNTLDWSRQNVLAVALGQAVFLWNASECCVTQLLELTDDDLYVSSLSWAEKGKYLAVGVSNGDIQLWDIEKEKKIRTMRGHEDRVSSLHWNTHTLSSGSRKGEVYLHDVRKPEHCISQLRHHRLEVCGLRWSTDGRHLASGGNDNIVCLWNPSRTSDPTQVLSGHEAAVKALAWCPWQPNVLATGGGSNDKTIRFWNTTSGECLQSINTKSQVSSVMWSKDTKEIISSHGLPRNQLTIWKYPGMTKVAELKGHEDRILNVAMSPRRTRVISAGADETLRIWKCFDAPCPPRSHSIHEGDSMSSLLLGGIY